MKYSALNDDVTCKGEAYFKDFRNIQSGIRLSIESLLENGVEVFVNAGCIGRIEDKDISCAFFGFTKKIYKNRQLLGFYYLTTGYHKTSYYLKEVRIIGSSVSEPFKMIMSSTNAPLLYDRLAEVISLNYYGHSNSYYDTQNYLVNPHKRARSLVRIVPGEELEFQTFIREVF